MMRALDDLIERRIVQAQRDGEFDGLPGSARPLPDDAEPLVPEEVRAAYRVLRNAGLVPPEVDALRRLAGRPGEPGLPASRMTALAVTLERRGVRLASPAIAGYVTRLRDKLIPKD